MLCTDVVRYQTVVVMAVLCLALQNQYANCQAVSGNWTFQKTSFRTVPVITGDSEPQFLIEVPVEGGVDILLLDRLPVNSIYEESEGKDRINVDSSERLILANNSKKDDLCLILRNGSLRERKGSSYWLYQLRAGTWIDSKIDGLVGANPCLILGEDGQACVAAISREELIVLRRNGDSWYSIVDECNKLIPNGFRVTRIWDNCIWWEGISKGGENKVMLVTPMAAILAGDTTKFEMIPLEPHAIVNQVAYQNEDGIGIAIAYTISPANSDQLARSEYRLSTLYISPTSNDVTRYDYDFDRLMESGDDIIGLHWCEPGQLVSVIASDRNVRIARHSHQITEIAATHTWPTHGDNLQLHYAIYLKRKEMAPIFLYSFGEPFE